MQEKGAKADQIAVLFSEDSHYSMPKGANILNLRSIVLKVEDDSRQIIASDLEEKLKKAQEEGIEHFIIVLNLSTTMFGSVDDIEMVTSLLHEKKVSFKLHVDAAFGGFIYPFANASDSYSFRNPNISSITIDGHKMLQSPYGTGIFLVRKGLMKYVCTREASYIPEKDYTICGSRSGANAVAVWMILMVHGSNGWTAKIQQLLDRTDRLCERLKKINVTFFRNPHLNIIAIKANQISKELADKYHLVADRYEEDAQWYKIVIMPHVKQGILDSFFAELEAGLTLKSSYHVH
jgi:glutamate/tyrosine decarboxylase-like PLP-dependent enzyme